ncbi:MAG: SAM-dependent methyltransferase [Tenericutes bacterium]|nr:MAG: SAM-dependent methyltransferase [Mycoplasmatota bacterium]
MKKKWNRGNLLSTSSAYWKGCALQAGVRLGVFTALHDQRLHLDEVAVKIEADQRGTEYLLNALAAMGLLVKDDTHYANSHEAQELLSKNSKMYMGHIILHHHHILDGWAQLDQAVKNGAPVQKRSYGEDVERASFLMGMFNLGMGIAPQLASQVDLSGRTRLLDLGGGPGTYAIHFCQANLGLSAVIFDRSTTEPFARKTIARFGLSERIDFAAGDFNIDPISGGPYDVAWLSHILHSNGPEECQRLINKTVEVMKPGGLILIHEFILENTKDAPEFAALFSINMLINNHSGRSYSVGELEEMLFNAGVKDIARHSFQGPNDSSIIYGTV